MQIHGLSVCVNYSDFLRLTWPKNKKFLSTYTVVTSTTDLETQRYCKENRITCIKSNVYLTNNAAFNKGRMLNVGLRHIRSKHLGEWVLSIDADTFVDVRNILCKLNTTYMYGAKRVLLETYEQYTSGVGVIEDFVGEWPHCMVGYFQLFNKRNIWYGEDFHTAETCDHRFFFDNYNRWDSRTFLETELLCYHLGYTCTNWHGRVTPLFVPEICNEKY